MKRKGFTLIELVVVIVILGIVAVAVAPKFLNIQTSARISSLDGIANAFRGAITQVQSKAYIKGLMPSNQNPGGTNQDEYILDFGIGSVEVDWGTLCPESIGESGEALTMLDFLSLSLGNDITTAIGNRHTVVGYKHSFTTNELNSENIPTLPSGCYVLYDSFGGRQTSLCPQNGCECSVRVEKSGC
ncbi:TPA: prepilin-type N-terminal cleavage/methylation domain-containing protein [Vibrio vulnificus]|nr:prepilin-type N-terminal cleavage/methylation domain-containing protein [Vibrio vulnificus]